MGEDKKQKCRIENGRLICDKSEDIQEGSKEVHKETSSSSFMPMPIEKMPEGGITCDMKMKEEPDGVRMRYTCRPLQPKKPSPKPSPEPEKKEPVEDSEGGEE